MRPFTNYESGSHTASERTKHEYHRENLYFHFSIHTLSLSTIVTIPYRTSRKSIHKHAIKLEYKHAIKLEYSFYDLSQTFSNRFYYIISQRCLLSQHYK